MSSLMFYGMLLAHLLYDFHWQGSFIAEWKGKSLFILSVHALTWAMLLGVVMMACGRFSLVWLGYLFVTHAVIDAWKCRLPQNPDYFWAIFVDQGLHVLTISAACL